jgi:hypothetical protein
MRRFQIPCAALVAGLAALLSGCAGETPTAPTSPPGPGAGGTGPCSTVISLSASSLNPVTAAAVRATVTKAGVPVPDGGSVQFTTDLGLFGENGLQTVSKTIVDGVADVSVFSSSGTAHVTAVLDCATAQLSLRFSGAPAVGPFISSVSPTTGSCAGGDTITILGGRFDGTIDVRFGGVSGSIVSSTATQIVVRTPSHTPKDPAVPDTVDLVVSAGGAQTAPVPFTFVCVLTPVINSASPRTGPNDASTRVTIFGSGFQFPMQVFLTGGACGLQRVEAEVSDITLTTIVFKTPVAVGGNVCLSNQLVDIVILNPTTGKTASCPACFKYFSCPTITSIGPSSAPYNVSTQVAITGHNFEEPATVSGGGTVWAPISVSSQQILAAAPPAILTGSCQDIQAPVLVNGTSLNCPNAVGPIFTYFVKTLSPSITSIFPSSVPEAGGTVTVTGRNFIDNMRVVLNNVNVPSATAPPSQITFIAPAFTDAFKTVACTVGSATGTRKVPTSVPLHILNVTTTCVSADDQLTYNPADPSCVIPPVAPAPVTVVTATLPDGTNGTPYSQSLVATGGTPGYTWTVVSGALPTGLNLSLGGLISGTPTVVNTFNFSVRATDSVGASGTAVLAITVN